MTMNAPLDPINTLATMEQLWLEVFSNYYLLERHKEEVGLITQWGAGAWLMLQELNESNPQTESQLARHQHISQGYNHRLTSELINNKLLKKLNEDEDPLISITESGKHALTKLNEVLHQHMPNWASEFTAEELSITVQTLSKMRHLLTK